MPKKKLTQNKDKEDNDDENSSEEEDEDKQTRFREVEEDREEGGKNEEEYCSLGRPGDARSSKSRFSARKRRYGNERPRKDDPKIHRSYGVICYTTQRAKIQMYVSLPHTKKVGEESDKLRICINCTEYCCTKVARLII